MNICCDKRALPLLARGRTACVNCGAAYAQDAYGTWHLMPEHEVDLADVFGYGPSAPGWKEPHSR